MRGFVGCTLALGILAMSAQAQEIRWQPKAATGNVVCLPGSGDCGDKEIILSAGGVTVTLFLEVSGWDTAGGGNPGNTDYFLGAFQGTVDSGTYVGGAPGNPGTMSGYDLDPVGQATGEGFKGAFQALKVCASDPFDVVGSSDLMSYCSTPADCPEFNVCTDRWDFVYFQLDATCTVSTATIDYSWSCASTDCKEDPRDGTRYYGGTLLLEVPGGAKGTYNVNYYDDPNFTLFNSCPGPMIPGLVLGPGSITIQTGKCCYKVGVCDEPDELCCEDDLTLAECMALPGPHTDPVIVPDETCDVEGCIECLTAFDCNDGNACTDDSCDENFICQNDTNYAVGVVCCDPATGATVVIDDGIQCTQDLCDELTGIVTHPPMPDGTVCTDAEVTTCFHDFRCDAGVCLGTNINTVPCPGGLGTCPEGSSACEDTGMCGQGEPLCCVCIACTGLVIDVDAGPKPDENCFLLGETVNMQVAIEAGSSTVTGGQFLIEYPTDCLDLVSVNPCPGSIFDTVPFKVVDEDAGTIFYVVLIEPFKRCALSGGICLSDADCPTFLCEITNDISCEVDPFACDVLIPPEMCLPFPMNTCVLTTGSMGPADMACMEFIKLDGCDECEVCFDNVNPQDTMLTDDEGYSVDICDPFPSCSKPIRLAGTIEVDGPDGEKVNSDCGLPTALVDWDTPTAFDTCDGEREVLCYGAYAHNVGEPAPLQAFVDGLIMNGGEFQQGLYFFQCTAENTCGNIDTHVWTVEVSDKNTLDVEVHLAPPLIAGALSRCICFELYADCYSEPMKECFVLDFGPPLNFRGHARDSLKIDKDNYLCITAADQLHTLPAVADVECVDNAWKAVWKGDPLLGGNWLIGGNLDGKKAEGVGSPLVIDVLDFGKFIQEIARSAWYPTGDTTCEMIADSPHGDINGDGLVDNIDFSIIQMNFLMHAKDSCCPDPEAAAPVPITEISVKELRRMGLGELSAADLNGDGLLNMEDMTSYQQGIRFHGKRSSFR